jgi:anti-sigma regulatory factor (Ser/Thr protein kinase)
MAERETTFGVDSRSAADGQVRIGELAQALNMSIRVLRRMADTGEIPSTRTPGGHRTFDVAAVRSVLALDGKGELGPRRVEPIDPPTWSTRHSLSDLEEHLVWREMIADTAFDESTPAASIMRYGFTEMLNNAIDHSGGTVVEVRVWTTEDILAFRIVDDGEGVFAHLRDGLGLADDLEAISELTKGKRTTWKERHTGEGIFFTSKQVDIFQLSAVGLRWTVDNHREDQAVGRASVDIGTVVYGQVDARTTRSTREVFQQFSEGHEFMRTRPVVKLFGLGVSFVSRSEARRLLDGMDDFTDIDVDFAGVEDVGQGFVDELLRVWPAANPGKRITPINMNEAVEFMVRRGLPGPPGRGTH